MDHGAALVLGANEAFAGNPTCTAAAVTARILTDPKRRVADCSSAPLGVFAASPPRGGDEFADRHYWFRSGLATNHTYGPSHPIGKQRAQRGCVALRERRCRERGSCRRGSFEPVDAGSFAGGGVYATSMAVLALQVYRRYPDVLSAKAP